MMARVAYIPVMQILLLAPCPKPVVVLQQLSHSAFGSMVAGCVDLGPFTVMQQLCLQADLPCTSAYSV